VAVVSVRSGGTPIGDIASEIALLVTLTLRDGKITRGMFGGPLSYGALGRGPLDKTIDTLTHTFNGPLSGTTRVSQYQKGKNRSGYFLAAVLRLLL